MERKNGWQLAEQAGDATPYGVQRLLSTYCWDADLVRDDLAGYVVEHLGDTDGVLVVDETGFLKKGNKSAGVQRQYSGTAGRIENCQIGVFLAYVSAKGRTLLDRELYLPQVWTEDRERRREAGVPEDVGFQTKPQLAQRMLERALESGVPFGWVAGDEVYGNDRNLRLWLEREGIAHVLAIKSNEKLWACTDKGPLQVRADRLASQVDESDWNRCSAGDGAKGPRVYDWALVEIRPLKEPGKGYWLLARRSVAKPEELAYYVQWGRSYLPGRKPGHFIRLGPLSHLGAGIPYGMAAKLAQPESKVIVLCGDGSFGFYTMEYDTCLRHNLPITVVMGNDSNWGIDKTFQLAYYNRAVGTDLEFRRYDRVVEALGGHAEYVENTEDVAPAVDRAINSGLPPLVNVVVKPGASPLAYAMIARRTGR